MIKLRILGWGNHPGLSQWAQLTVGVPIRVEILEDSVLLILKVEEGGYSQQTQGVSRNWKRLGNRFSSGWSRRNTGLLTP